MATIKEYPLSTTIPGGHTMRRNVADTDFETFDTAAQYTDELAQDAVGAMVDVSLVYVDGTPLLTRAALTGHVTAAQGLNATTIASGVVTEAMQVLADNVTQDVSITKHGYVPKAPNLTTQFLRGDATWAAPAGGSGASLGLVVATIAGMNLS